MWHEALFDKLKVSAYMCKKERHVAFKIRQNTFPAPTRWGSSWRFPDSPVGCGGDTPRLMAKILLSRVQNCPWFLDDLYMYIYFQWVICWSEVTRPRREHAHIGHHRRSSVDFTSCNVRPQMIDKLRQAGHSRCVLAVFGSYTWQNTALTAPLKLGHGMIHLRPVIRLLQSAMKTAVYYYSDDQCFRIPVPDFAAEMNMF